MICVLIGLMMKIWQVMLESYRSQPIESVRNKNIQPTTKKYKLMSFEGGGIKGVATVSALQELFKEELDERDVFADFDGFVGTSTGAIIAASICGRQQVLHKMASDTLYSIWLKNALIQGGYSAGDATDICNRLGGTGGSNDPMELYSKYVLMVLDYLYSEKGQEIFMKTKTYEVLSLGGLLAPKYIDTGRRRTIHGLLGITFHELSQDLFIVAQSMAPDKDHKISLFTNFGKDIQNSSHDSIVNVDRSGQYWVSESVLMSSSAPTFFPMYKNHIDGGLSFNDPAQIAIMELSKAGYDPKVLSFQLETKRNFNVNPYAGLISWISPIINITMNNETRRTMMFEEYYKRTHGQDSIVNINVLDGFPSMQMDNLALVPKLKSHAKQRLHQLQHVELQKIRNITTISKN